MRELIDKDKHKLIPMDDPQELVCHTGFVMIINKIALVESKEGLEEVNREFESMKCRVIQLRECLTQATGDAKKFFAKTAKQKRDQDTAAEVKRKKDALEAEEMRVKKLRRAAHNRQRGIPQPSVHSRGSQPCCRHRAILWPLVWRWAHAPKCRCWLG